MGNLTILAREIYKRCATGSDVFFRTKRLCRVLTVQKRGRPFCGARRGARTRTGGTNRLNQAPLKRCPTYGSGDRRGSAVGGAPLPPRVSLRVGGRGAGAPRARPSAGGRGGVVVVAC